MTTANSTNIGATAARMRRIPEEIFNHGNLALADELFAADYVEHTPGLLPDFPLGRAGFKQYVTLLRTAYPDLHYTIEDEVVRGEVAAFHLAARGTNAGPLFGMPSTGRQAGWTETHIARCVDDVLVEHWACIDQLGMLVQLGVVPAPPGAASPRLMDVRTPQAAVHGEPGLSEDSMAALVRRLYDLLDRGEISALDEVLAPDYVDHTVPPGVPGDRVGFKKVVAQLHSAFHDLHQTIEDLIVAGDRVVVRSTLRGIHRGAFMGISATSKSMALAQIHIARISEGRLVEHWGNEDDLGMLRQLGVVPS